MQELQSSVQENNLPFIVTSGAASSSTEVGDPAALQPGSNFGIRLSYGDISSGAVGTTTVVCNGQAVALGHPAFEQGSTTMGANAADAITIVEGGPEDPFVSFKLANIAERVGVITEDRLAGVVAQLGAKLTTIPVKSSVTDLTSKRERIGLTEVVGSERFSPIASEHLAANIERVTERIGPGGALVSWTVNGVTKEGSPFQLKRTNRYMSREDIAVAPAKEFQSQLETLFGNDFTEVTFTGAEVDATVTKDLMERTIKRVEVSVAGGSFTDIGATQTAPLQAKPGDQITLRVTLSGRDIPDETVELAVTAPASAQGEGTLTIAGAPQDDSEFQGAASLFTVPSGQKTGATSFAELVAKLETAPRGDEIRAELTFGTATDPDTALEPASKDATLTDQVVRGSRALKIEVASPQSTQ